MAFLMIDGERYALPQRETTLGGSADEVLAASPLAALPPFAMLVDFDDSMTIRAMEAAPACTVNGEPLGTEPRPVRHGDRIQVGALEVHVGDERAVGSTGRASGVTDAQLTASSALPGTNPTAATGGALTAHADGTVQLIAASGLVIGRDPDCQVVIPSREVSRRHATIRPGLLGYILTDSSTNGSFVNGERVAGSQLLGDGDVVRVGDATFRFSADPASFEPDESVWNAPTTPLLEAQIPAPLAFSPATAPLPRQPRPTPLPLLATLDVIAGRVPVGLRFRIERSVVQLGRGAACDVCLVDESVSGAHATLMLRGVRWHLIDHASRNGTYVNDQRVEQCELPSACELRVGGVTLHFQAVATLRQSNLGTLGLIGLTDEQVDGRSRR